MYEEIAKSYHDQLESVKFDQSQIHLWKQRLNAEHMKINSYAACMSIKEHTTS